MRWRYWSRCGRRATKAPVRRYFGHGIEVLMKLEELDATSKVVGGRRNNHLNGWFNMIQRLLDGVP